MSALKDRMTDVIRSQPEDATYDEIMRELAFERMVERGMADVRANQTLPEDAVLHKVTDRF